MKTYRCICGNSVFYDNTQCLRCARALGFCPGCRSVTSLLPMEDGHVRCGQASCGIDLAKCSNYTQHAVCNRCLALSPIPALDAVRQMPGLPGVPTVAAARRSLRWRQGGSAHATRSTRRPTEPPGGHQHHGRDRDKSALVRVEGDLVHS